jgi:hypothetical protein
VEENTLDVKKDQQPQYTKMVAGQADSILATTVSL